MKYHLDVNFVPHHDITSALREFDEYRRNGERITYTLAHPTGKTILDKETFFDSVLHTFPLDPPIMLKNGYQWDPIQDSLRGGITNATNAEFIDIVWNDVHVVAMHSIPTLIEGILFFVRLTDWITEFYWGQKEVTTRILLVYEEQAAGFLSGFWHI